MKSKNDEKRLNKNSSIFVPPGNSKSFQYKKQTPSKKLPPKYPSIVEEKIKSQEEFNLTLKYINHLKKKTKREEAFKMLNNRREKEPNIASLLWYSIGSIAILLQEIISIYPYLTNMELTQKASEKMCNVLGLFQCIALDKKTRFLFLKANLHLYVYPLINTPNKQRPYEHLRVTSLGVIGALVKGDDPESIGYLVKTELIVLCLRIMKKGNDLSKSVATFIVLKILSDNAGLDYVCQTSERFIAVAQILKDMIEEMEKRNFNQKQNKKMYQRIVRCFLRLSENGKANKLLKKYVPGSFFRENSIICGDKQLLKWHKQLLENIGVKKGN